MFRLLAVVIYAIRPMGFLEVVIAMIVFANIIDIFGKFILIMMMIDKDQDKDKDNDDMWR